MKHRSVLLVGAPGSGKGTQGKILGSIPGFYHCACGDVFRSLDLSTELGRAFQTCSSRGELVSDELTIPLWSESVERLCKGGRVRAGYVRNQLLACYRRAQGIRVSEWTWKARTMFFGLGQSSSVSKACLE